MGRGTDKLLGAGLSNPQVTLDDLMVLKEPMLRQVWAQNSWAASFSRPCLGVLGVPIL